MGFLRHNNTLTNFVINKNMLLCSCVSSVASEQSSSDCVFKKSYYVNRKTCYYVIVSSKISYHV